MPASPSFTTFCFALGAEYLHNTVYRYTSELWICVWPSWLFFLYFTDWLTLIFFFFFIIIFTLCQTCGGMELQGGNPLQKPEGCGGLQHTNMSVVDFFFGNSRNQAGSQFKLHFVYFLTSTKMSTVTKSTLDPFSENRIPEMTLCGWQGYLINKE